MQITEAKLIKANGVDAVDAIGRVIPDDFTLDTTSVHVQVNGQEVDLSTVVISFSVFKAA